MGEGCRISLLPCSNLSAKLLRYGDSPFSPITPNSEIAEPELPSLEEVFANRYDVLRVPGRIERDEDDD